MLDEATLRRLYLEECLSIRAIAAQEQLPTRMIYDALIKYRIPRRPAGFRGQELRRATPALDEATLRRIYVEEGQSIRAIAELAGVSTRMIYDALIRYRIPRRAVGQRRPAPLAIVVGNGAIDKAALRRMYQDEGQTIATIAAAIACSPSRIRSALVRWGIARRRRGRPGGATSL